MEWYDVEVEGRRTVKFADLPYMPLLSPSQRHPKIEEHGHDIDGNRLGGIIRRGEWAWLSRNSMLQIVSLSNGQTISSYEFCDASGYENCVIKCVEEIYDNNTRIMLLAVVLDCLRGPGGGGSCIVLYSVELGCVVRNIELGLHVTCARFMEETACQRSLLQNFDGCLALGSEEGVIVLLNLRINQLSTLDSELDASAFLPCHIVDYTLPLTEIHRNFQECQKDGMHFALQMEVIASPCAIQCILPIETITAVAIGLEDGRMALYDLAELQIFHIAQPQREIAMSGVVKMDFLEPPDDPRPCVYIWALHENGENLYAVLHNLMYERRLMEKCAMGTTTYFFENFQKAAVRLLLPLEATQSVALACQSVATFSHHGEDDANCLCAISWHSVLEEKNKLLIFDLNQWYKAQMPYCLEFDEQPSYLAGYILDGQCTGLHLLLQRDTIAHFNSIQRFEEHFYPNSLSFDCSLLCMDGCRCYNWEGAQNRVINLLRVSNASVFLEPSGCFNEIMRARLMPQFSELNMNSTFSKNAKYEVMLSAALEYNCVSLLRDCAKSWIDGSFMGDFAVSTGLSLSTLTDWLWKRATAIKERCNELCKGVFEYAGYPLDQRELKELGVITRQLKLLMDLLGEILGFSKKHIPAKAYASLERNHRSLCMAFSYQDLLLWLLNIGLLPEASPYNNKTKSQHTSKLVPYPYKFLKDIYDHKRSFLNGRSEGSISQKNGSCRLLYIDAFIEHACKGNGLHEFWLENNGDGLYPPNSIEAMLRVMLVPDLAYEDKYSILLYFFLDLNLAIDENEYKHVVANFIKFPSVFKLSAPQIKTVQSFWNLDHNQFMLTVDEFISPFNKNQSYPQWLVELLIEALLTQDAANLALRILESQPSLISPILRLKTLLSNELIPEAFHFVRSRQDDTLLETFFTRCLQSGQFGVIRDLAITEHEGKVLQNILKKSKAPGSESLHLVYLLQKYKYIEAVSYMDELASKPMAMRGSLQQQRAGQFDTPNMVLSAFNTTMTPVTQGLTDVYFRMKNGLKRKEVDNKSPVPLSCQLIKQNANNLLGGVYHSSALSAHFATYYWGGEIAEQNQEKQLLSSNNAPFLRRPQNEANYVDCLAKNTLSYPQPYKAKEKRSRIESEAQDNAEEQMERQRLENQQNPRKKRRLIGQAIVDDLSHFMQMNKRTKTFDVVGQNNESTTAKPCVLKEQESVASISMIAKPYVPTRSQTIESTEEKQEIQGILKTTGGSDSGSHQPDEEKYLRFRLPSIDFSSNLVVEDDGSAEEMDTTECIEAAAPAAAESETRKRSLSRSVSVESTGSSNNSADNFYSPMSSQNNSKLDTSNVSRSSYTGGPKARKPLARLSAEREVDGSKSALCRLSAEKDNNEIKTSDAKMSLSLARTASVDDEKPAEAENELSTVATVTDTSVCNQSLLDTSHAAYLTALQESVSNIAPRKSLRDVVESSTLTYVTACETLTSMPSGLGKATDTNSRFSSGIGSISAGSTSTNSKINEFLPKVSSSKVGTAVAQKQDDNVGAKISSSGKLSECSTVVGSFEYTGSSTSQNVFAQPSVAAEKSTDIKHTEEEKRQMLDTTLGMSMYDVSAWESSSLQAAKSLVTSDELKAATTSDPVKEEEHSKPAKPEVEQPQDKEEEEDACTIPAVDEYKEEDACKIPVIDETAMESVNPSSWGDLMNSSDDDCIVVSSSSSYIDDNDYGRPFDFHTSDDNDDDDSSRETLVHPESEQSFDTGKYDEHTNNTPGIEENSTDDSFDYEAEAEDDDEVMELNESSSEMEVNSSSSGGSNSGSGDTVLIEGKVDTMEQQVSSSISSSESSAEIVPALATAPILGTNISDVSPQLSCVDENKTLVPESKESLAVMDSQVLPTSAPVAVIESVETAAERPAEDNASPTAKKVDDASPTDKISHEEAADQEEQITLRMEDNDSNDASNLRKLNQSPNEADETNTEESSAHDDSSGTKEDKTNSPSMEANKTNEDVNKRNSEKNAVDSAKEKSFDVVESSQASTSKRSLRAPSIPPAEDESTSSKAASLRRSVRASSISLEEQAEVAPSPRRFPPRGISVPPQVAEAVEEIATTPTRSRRSLRASSLQPHHLNEGLPRTLTPGKLENIEEHKESGGTFSRSVRASSVPKGSKLPVRSRSALLDAINEGTPIADSPSANTRLKSRLNSIDSDLDHSLVGSEQSIKRTRPLSVTGADQATTPKRTRRSSISSQPDLVLSVTPRMRRGRSILSVVEDENESIPASPSSTTTSSSRRGNTKRKTTAGEQEHADIATKKNEKAVAEVEEETKDASAGEKILYSTTTRRLTRNQLAIMEKSAALVPASTDVEIIDLEISPPSASSSTKRTTRAKTGSRSTLYDSDDGESLSSRRSTTLRRVTRNSQKEKEEQDDDVISISSSVGSERNLRKRLSKDNTSPNTTLSAIPESAAVEHKKRGRKPMKK